MLELTHAERIRILNTLGVDTPADTKVLDNIVEERLCDAVDTIQFRDLFPASMVSRRRVRVLAKAVQRHIPDDARHIGPSLSAVESEEAAAFGNPFGELRGTMRPSQGF